jgi:hypothetical protein
MTDNVETFCLDIGFYCHYKDRMKTHITDELVAHLKEKDVVWDDLDTGFGVRRQRHSSIFIVRYRADRKRHCITIGRHSEISAEEARDKARSILANVRKRTINRRRGMFANRSAELCILEKLPSDIWLNLQRHGKNRNLFEPTAAIWNCIFCLELGISNFLRSTALC